MFLDKKNEVSRTCKNQLGLSNQIHLRSAMNDILIYIHPKSHLTSKIIQRYFKAELQFFVWSQFLAFAVALRHGDAVIEAIGWLERTVFISAITARRNPKAQVRQ